MTKTTLKHSEQVRDHFDDRWSQYNGFYEPSSRFHRWLNHVFRKAVYARRDQVLTLAKQFNCRSVLDIGSGGGHNAAWWALHGIQRVHGVEFSPKMIHEAHVVTELAGVANQCTFELADFMQWESDQRYDMVVACGVFDYVVEAEAFLRHMSRFATKVVYASFPKWTLFRSPIRRVRYKLRGCPTFFYSQNEIKILFQAADLGDLAIQETDAGYLAWSIEHHS